MKANIQQIRKTLRYTEEFKKSIVRDYESGKFSVPELERLHCISNPSIYAWIYKYSSVNKRGYRIVEMEKSSLNKIKDLEQRIQKLESVVGRKQIEIDFLEKMIDLAKNEYDIDIKKNYNTPQSGGSEKTKGE